MNIKFKKMISIALTLAIMLAAFVCMPATASAANAATAQDAFLRVAVNELGYTESGVDQTKYGKWFGAQVAWCCIFVSWCANETDLRFGTNMYGDIFPQTGTCQSSMQWYKARGEFHTRSSGYIPKKGDLIYFNWGSGSSAQHIGIVEYVSKENGSTIINQLSGNFGNAVKRFSYKSTDTRIIGYASPDYASQGVDFVDNGSGNLPEYNPDNGIAEFNGAAKTTVDLNVRSGPSTGYDKIGVLPEGTKVNVIGKFKNGWYKIEYNGNGGSAYVSGDYLDFDDANETTTETTTVTTTKPDTGVVPMNATGRTTANLNVRTGPSTGYDKIGVAPNGTKLAVTGKVSGSVWYQVSFNNRTGYVSGDYLRIEEETTAPTTTTTKPTTTTTTVTTTAKPTTTVTTTEPTTAQPDDEEDILLGRTTANLNMRKGPSTSYLSLGVAPNGTKLTVTGKVAGSPAWYQVIYNGVTAYACSTYIKLIDEQPAASKPVTTTTTTTTTKPTTTAPTTTVPTTTKPSDGNQVSTGTGVTTGPLNMRKGPSTAYGRLTVIPTGVTVKILDKTTNGGTVWYKVTYGTLTGYVSGDYLRDVKFNQQGKDWTDMDKYMTATEYLNVRPTPSTAQARIGVIEIGSKVHVVGKYDNGWYRIAYNGGYACVCGSYLK